LKGRGEARGAITIINAIAAGKGCAVGVDLRTWAEVELSPGKGVEARLEGLEGEPTRLVEMCASAVLERFSLQKRATLRLRSQIPVSRGLKSSSAAANATILATLDAINERMSPIEILRTNAEVSIASDTSVTGAMDDAAASLLGGTVFTDNAARTLLKREEWTLCPRAVINVPGRMIRKQGLPRERIALYRPLVEEAFHLAWNGRYVDAMCLNSLCYGAALGLDQELVMRALTAGAIGAGISGTGPAVAALVTEERERAVAEAMGPGSIIVDIYQGVPE
jgi:shikimate kinase